MLGTLGGILNSVPDETALDELSENFIIFEIEAPAADMAEVGCFMAGPEPDPGGRPWAAFTADPDALLGPGTLREPEPEPVGRVS